MCLAIPLRIVELNGADAVGERAQDPDIFLDIRKRGIDGVLLFRAFPDIRFRGHANHQTALFYHPVRRLPFLMLRPASQLPAPRFSSFHLARSTGSASRSER